MVFFSSNTPTPSATHTLEPTPTETETPLPSPTPEPTAQPMTDFSEATFVYDGDGYMVKSVIDDVSTYYIGGYYELKVDGTTETETKYYTGPTGRFAMRVEGTLYWIFSDHLQSSSVILSEVGWLVSRTDYTAFGEVRAETGTSPTDYQYTGQRSYTDDFGLMYYNARWYDPVLAHFAQADSIKPNPGNSGDWNRYAYVLYNPINFNDPTGHDPKCGPDGVWCDNDEWNDIIYDPVPLELGGRRILEIKDLIEQYSGQPVSLYDIMRIIFEREFGVLGIRKGVDELQNAMAEAAVRNYLWRSEKLYGTTSTVALINWLGLYNQVAAQLKSNLQFDIPKGNNTYRGIIGDQRTFKYNSGSASYIANSLLNIPDAWSQFNEDRPFGYATCTIIDCMITNAEAKDRFLEGEIVDTNFIGSYVFNTNLQDMYFKFDAKYFITYNQQFGYWNKK